MSDAKLEKLQNVAFGLVPMGFTTASAMAEQQAARIMIGTGCKELDDILEGGLESGSITEIYGEYRCGKTQFCHTLAVTCQKEVDMGGGEGKSAMAAQNQHRSLTLGKLLLSSCRWLQPVVLIKC